MHNLFSWLSWVNLGLMLVEQKQKITFLLKEIIILYFLMVIEEIVVIIKIMEDIEFSFDIMIFTIFI